MLHVVQGILCTVQNMPKTTPFGDKNDVSWNEVWFQEEAEVCVAALQAPGQLGGSTSFNELAPKIIF